MDRNSSHIFPWAAAERDRASHVETHGDLKSTAASVATVCASTFLLKTCVMPRGRLRSMSLCIENWVSGGEQTCVRSHARRIDLHNHSGCLLSAPSVCVCVCSGRLEFIYRHTQKLSKAAAAALSLYKSHFNLCFINYYTIYYYTQLWRQKTENQSSENCLWVTIANPNY